MSKKTLISLLITAVLAGIIYFFRPVSINHILSLNGLIEYAKSFGQVMPAVVFVVTLVQAIVPLIPFVLICSANGLLFGTVQGTLFTLAASLAGASLAFFLARFAGGRWSVSSYQGFFICQENLYGLRGFWIILASRLQPYIPAPAINVLAGISRISFLWFLLASALGKLPFIAGYTILGNTILNSREWAMGTGILVVFLLVSYLTGRRKQAASLLKGGE